MTVADLRKELGVKYISFSVNFNEKYDTITVTRYISDTATVGGKDVSISDIATDRLTIDEFVNSEMYDFMKENIKDLSLN